MLMISSYVLFNINGQSLLHNTQERRRIGAEIDEFRSKYQRPEDRREYDLNDPDVLKKQLPPRASDGEPVGLSSAQKYENYSI